MEKFLSFENDLPLFERIILRMYFFLNHFALTEARAFGLDSSLAKIEKFPMVIKKRKEMNLRRI
jgi:KUP system potassium uptake protein